MDKIILAFAETEGKTASLEEKPSYLMD